MSTDRHFPSFWSLHLAGWAALGLAMWLGALALPLVPRSLSQRFYSEACSRLPK